MTLRCCRYVHFHLIIFFICLLLVPLFFFFLFSCPSFFSFLFSISFFFFFLPVFILTPTTSLLSLHSFSSLSFFLQTYGQGPYSRIIRDIEKEVEKVQTSVKELCGIKESDTGLSLPSQWDLAADKQMMGEEQPALVARCTKIIDAGTDDAKYMITVRQIAKYVVALGERVAPTDIEEAMRVGVDRTKYSIQIPLPPKIDPSVTMMTVEDKPDVTYEDIGGANESIEQLREGEFLFSKFNNSNNKQIFVLNDKY